MAIEAPETAELESQDLAEVFDETNLTEDGVNIANFDEIDDVYDATTAQGDARDVEALDADELNPDALDDEDLEDDEDEDQDDKISDQDAEGRAENADLDDEEEPIMRDADDKAIGPTPDDVADEVHPHQDELLDEGVEETFPASDPVSVKRIT